MTALRSALSWMFDLVALATQLTHSQVDEETRYAVGALHARLIKSTGRSSLQDAEFRAFSQGGEDGIIQYLINKIPIVQPWFAEIGVGDYSESNTRFLLTHDNWSGLIIDSGSRHINFLRNRSRMNAYWKYDIQALKEYVTKDNINSLLISQGMPVDAGLVSIDIDGNDYWIFQEITQRKPRIIIVEYNGLFGNRHAITIPYIPDFQRARAHYSNLYFGASLPALCDLAEMNGYVFVGSNSGGVNAFFVRRDVHGDLPALSAEEGYVPRRFRESRNRNGALTYISSHQDQLRLISHLPVYDTRHKKVIQIGQLFELHQDLR